MANSQLYRDFLNIAISSQVSFIAPETTGKLLSDYFYYLCCLFDIHSMMLYGRNLKDIVGYELLELTLIK